MRNRNVQFTNHTVRLKDGVIFASETGDKSAPALLFLHGWPESWESWRDIMSRAAPSHRAIAIDLPGIGKSAWTNASGNKRAIATIVHEVIKQLELKRVTLVGHDIGGQIVYAFLTQYDQQIERAVIIDVAVPGVAPWNEVISNPAIWHFAFHALPELPEKLVYGRQADYFNYFYQTIASDPKRISLTARHAYTKAYRTVGALKTGFEWYRNFTKDAEQNQDFYKSGGTIATPLLYIRGSESRGDMRSYEAGFRAAGIHDVTTAVIKDSGHFVAEEQPERLWKQVSTFCSA